jgi:hypothetical protein
MHAALATAVVAAAGPGGAHPTCRMHCAVHLAVSVMTSARQRERRTGPQGQAGAPACASVAVAGAMSGVLGWAE